MKWELIFKGESSNDYGIFPINERVNVPSAQRDVTEVEVPGRDGALYIDNGRFKPIVIPVKLNFKSLETDYRKRKIERWLSGSGNLKFTYDNDIFYKCKKVELSDWESAARTGKITANFYCDPFAYSDFGQIEIKNPTELHNDGYIAKPCYRIIGEGLCNLSVNKNTITVNVGQNVTINTDLLIAYREDGEVVNTTISGNIENLVLQEGKNTIEITENFELYVTPGWRY